MYLKQLLFENRLPLQFKFRQKLSVPTVEKNDTSILGGVGVGGGGHS